MAWNIEFMACSSYELDHKPTDQEIEEFRQCFLSDLLDGYIDIESDKYPLDSEDE